MSLLSRFHSLSSPPTRLSPNSATMNSPNAIPKTSSLSFPFSTPKFEELSFRKLPILLFDIMDTIVRDPFYHDVPAFFGMTMKELLEIKHPTAWIEFELGLIDEAELTRKFFKDGRPLDLKGLKECMMRGYSYISGVEDLLSALKSNNYEMHTFTNYPIWCEMIEEKLKISNHLSWTFCSFKNGKRKPDLEYYRDVVKHLKAEPENCVFVDDRMTNVEAARAVGMVGVQFKNTDTLRRDLCQIGVDLSQDSITEGNIGVSGDNLH